MFYFVKILRYFAKILFEYGHEYNIPNKKLNFLYNVFNVVNFYAVIVAIL